MPSSSQVTLYEAALNGDEACVQALLDNNADPSIPNEYQLLPLHYALLYPMNHNGVEEDNEDLINNKIRIAQMLIKKTPQTLAFTDEAGDTPVHLMAARGFSTLLSMALPFNSALAFTPNHAGACPIHAAIANHQYGASQVLLAIPVMSELVDFNDKSLVHHAAAMNNLPVLEQLLNVHHHTLPHIHDLDVDGETALEIAKINGFTKISEFLEEHGRRGPACC